MKATKSLTIIAFAVASLAASRAGTFTTGNLVLGRVGDGLSPLVNSGGPISVLEYNSSGALQQTINVSSMIGGLQVSGTATSELALSRSADNQQLVVAGYVPPFTGSGSLAGRSSTDAPRGFVTIGNDGNVSTTIALTGNYSADNIRSGVTSGSNAWFTGSPGSGSGLVYHNGTSQTQIQDVNSRVADIHNGSLYFSSASAGTIGIFGYSGLPTTAASATSVIAGVSGQGSNAYDFAFDDLNTIAYIADSTVGVQKFTWNGSAWSHAYNITTAATGLTGLAVDFSGADPIIYALNPTTLYSYTDTGSGAMTSIATAGTNYAFRGLDFAPIPESSAALLGGLGMLGLLRRRR